MQPAVPLWKVIADFGRRELQPDPQGSGFFFVERREINIPKSHAESGQFHHLFSGIRHNLRVTWRKNTNSYKRAVTGRQNRRIATIDFA
jgi:hypothetical protein